VKPFRVEKLFQAMPDQIKIYVRYFVDTKISWSIEIFNQQKRKLSEISFINWISEDGFLSYNHFTGNFSMKII
jgi:hypothetical protein